jgi:hypothetical protein
MKTIITIIIIYIKTVNTILYNYVVEKYLKII